MKTIRLGLRFEIVVSLTLLVAAAAGFMGLAVFQYAQEEMIAQEVSSGLILVAALEEVMRREPVADQKAQISRILSVSGFSSLEVKDSSGRSILRMGSKPEAARPGAGDFLLAISSNEIVARALGEPFWPWGPKPALALTVPLKKGVPVKAAVGLYSSLTRLRSAWSSIRWIMFIYLGVDTVVMVLFGSYLLSFRLIFPLKRLSGRVMDLAEGRLEPLRITSVVDNEIGRLETAFEQMAEHIASGRQELENHLVSLREAQEGLIRSEKMATVGRLGAGLAHELGNPLGSILGFIHLLRDDLDPEEKKDFLDRMEAEICRMDEILRALLDFARPSTSQAGPVDLNQVVKDALALAGVQKWFGRVGVQLEQAENLPPVHGEVNRLTQVILNLLANAGQAMNGEGRVSIETRAEDREVTVTVSDTGPGIAPEDLDHLFEPFFTRKEPGQGTGLGLSVSLAIVESFGGRIEVRSRPGEGAEFTMTLPQEPKVEADP